MHAQTLLWTTLALVSVVSAGPHDLNARKIRYVHRRHHAKRAGSSRRDDAEDATPSSFSASQAVPAAVASSSAATTGSDLLASSSYAVDVNENCTLGDWRCQGMALQECYSGGWNTVQNCSGTNIICSADPSAVGCVWTWSVPSQASSVVSSAAATSASASVVSTAVLVDPSAVVASSTSSAVASASSAGLADPNDDDDYCDESDEDESSSAAASSSTSASITSPSTSTTNGTLGQELYAGHGQGQSLSATVTSTSSEVARETSSTSNSGRNRSKSASATMTSATASVTYGSNGKASSSSRVSASRTASASSTASSSVTSNSTSSLSSWSAPHYVIYADNWLSTMPSVSDLGEYNRFILAFWMSSSGPVDNALAWAGFSDSDRQQVIEEYHAAGIALMVSAFGSTDSPTTSGMDPATTAQDLALFVQTYGLDGVDIDYEDMTAMNSDQAEAWLITFQTELRELLPEPYIISHAPVAPWFTSANDYASGAYVKIHQDVGDGIDFYNIQFYNQGDDQYVSCDTLITDAGSSWPSTSVFEINSYAGVPLDKIVIGKPLDSGAASNGYMDPSTLSTCVEQAEAKGWNGGVMFWEWSDEAASVMATVLG